MRFVHYEQIQARVVNRADRGQFWAPSLLPFGPVVWCRSSVALVQVLQPRISKLVPSKV